MDTKVQGQQETSPITGKVVAIAGATGNVGEGITRALLRTGAKVLALTRSEEKVAALRQLLENEAIENLIGVSGDTSSPSGMRNVAHRIETEQGPIDHAVISLGQWWKGKPVWDISDEEFQKYFVQTAMMHFGAARALVPILKDGGSYTMLAGLSAVKPIPGLSLIGMAGAAHLMLGRELQADVGDRVRVNSLVLGFIRSRGRPTGEPSWLTAEDVGDLIIRVAGSQIAGREIRADNKMVVKKAIEELGL